MAYMSQDRKKAIAALVKPILAKYGVSATFGVRNHSTLVMNIKSGAVDFIGDFGMYHGAADRGYIDVNPYHYTTHFTGKALEFLKAVMPVLNTGNHDNSDIQTDYFDVGWYVDVNIGNWQKPYVLVK